MDNQIREAFDAIRTPERVKRMTKAHLRRRTFDYGRNVLRMRQRQRKLAAGLLSLALVFSGLGLWFLPTTNIAVDINPSINIRVNALDRVISLEGLNADGEALAAALDVSAMPYGEAMGRIMVSDELGAYLKAGSLLSITVSGRGAEQTLNQVVCRAYAVADDDQVFYILADSSTVKAARELGLTVAQYEALTVLRKSDPEATPEQVRAMTMAEIRELIGFEKLDDPCGEKKEEN